MAGATACGVPTTPIRVEVFLAEVICEEEVEVVELWLRETEAVCMRAFVLLGVRVAKSTGHADALQISEDLVVRCGSTDR